MKKLILALVWLVLLGSIASLGARALHRDCNIGSDACCVEEAADVDPDCWTAGVRCDTCDGGKPDDYCCTEKSGCSVTVDGNPPSTISVPIWTYLYGAECKVKSKYDPDRGITCTWTWKYKNCSASDRCEGGPNQSGACQNVSDAEMFSVSNSSGHILAGQCSASECSEEGCKNGGWYKTSSDSQVTVTSEVTVT